MKHLRSILRMMGIWWIDYTPTKEQIERVQNIEFAIRILHDNADLKRRYLVEELAKEFRVKL